jgi:hypothetical protein
MGPSSLSSQPSSASASAAVWASLRFGGMAAECYLEWRARRERAREFADARDDGGRRKGGSRKKRETDGREGEVQAGSSSSEEAMK